MNRFNILAALTASALFAQAGVAQQNDVDPASNGSVHVQNTALTALGSLVAGPYDVETPPFDNRCLGVEEMGGFLWVTGTGHTTVGNAYKVHQYSMTGTYIQSFSQVSNAASWGGRDMVSNGNTLYIGSDSAEVSEYLWNGTTLTHVALHTVPGVVGTIRALAQRPGDGHFFTKSFTSSQYEFILTGSIATKSNTTLSAYGYGWDDCSASIWATTTGPSVQEVDADCVFKSGAFGLTWGTAQGGADVFFDSRNPGFYSMVILGQGTPDQMEVYDLAVPCGGPPSFTLAKTGSCGAGSMTLSTTNGTPTGNVAYIYGNAGLKTKPSGVCAGTTVNIANPKKLAIASSAGGSSSFTFTPPGALCGKTIQAVQVGVGPCNTTNTIVL